MKSRVPSGGGGTQTFNLGEDIRAFAKVVDRRIDYVHRNISMMLFTSILYGTPVDTGLARGSWWVSKGAPATGPEREDKDGSTVAREIESVVMSANVGDVLWFMNNVAYIVELEYGWSPQARSPDGMVRINVARVQQYMKQVVSEARNVK